MKKILICMLIVLVCLGNFAGFSYADGENADMQDYLQDEPVVTFEKGKVLESENFHMEGDYPYDYQMVSIAIISGEYSGEVVEIENVLSDNVAYNIEVKKNDRVILMIETGAVSRNIYISDFSRNGMLKVLVAIFLGLLLIIGRGKGLKSVITITLTILLIFKVLLPGILRGWNPLLLTIIIAILITVLTILTISGFCKKSYAAIIGTVSGVVIAGIIAIVVGHFVKLTGMSVDEASMLMYIPQQIDFDFKDLLFAGILLGALGAVMDIAMSIASAIHEIYHIDQSLSRKKLFKSGMSIGRDIMGTMSNTLILAYTGSSIPLLLLLLAYDTPLAILTNMDLIATEVVRSLAGSIGLILTIPITAISAVLLLKKEK